VVARFRSESIESLPGRDVSVPIRNSDAAKKFHQKRYRNREERSSGYGATRGQGRVFLHGDRVNRIRI
jgi:hypothetical protein